MDSDEQNWYRPCGLAQNARPRLAFDLQDQAHKTLAVLHFLRYMISNNTY